MDAAMAHSQRAASRRNTAKSTMVSPSRTVFLPCFRGETVVNAWSRTVFSW
jgi:hypothetical protein